MSHRKGTASTSSWSESAVFSAAAIQRSVSARLPRRDATTARPHAAVAIRRGFSWTYPMSVARTKRDSALSSRFALSSTKPSNSIVIDRSASERSVEARS